MTRRPQRWVVVSFGSAVLVAGAILGIGAQDTRPAGAASSRAVVNIGGSNHTVSFASTVTGLQALRMVASVSTVGFGGSKGEAVCSINGQGNPATLDECLVGPNGEYWSYWRAQPGAGGLQYSPQGAGGTVVSDGWVEGWRYGTGGPPPFTSFCAVAGCAPPPTAAPPTTAPPTTAPAPSVAGSSVTAPGASGSGGSTATTRSKGAGATAVDDSGDDQASTQERADGSRNDGDRERAAGTTGAGDDADGGSPAGIVAVGGIVAALGVGGVALRRRQGAPVPPG